MSRVTQITSDKNEVFRSLRDCLSSKGIKKHGLFVVSGERAVKETLAKFPELVADVILAEGQNPISAPPKASILQLKKELFEELDVFGTRSPLLAVRTPEIPIADLDAPPKGLEILCAMGDPSNVGALLRSASALGASRVILLEESASPFHPKAVRAASATTLLTPLARGPKISEVAGPVVALDMSGESLDGFAWPRDVRLLIGEEGQGVPNRQSHKLVSIPMTPGVESLNAAIASSIALYSYRLRHPLSSATANTKK